MQEGHINTVSVAVRHDNTLEQAGRAWRELLNVGVVAVPSNREARVTSNIRRSLE